MSLGLNCFEMAKAVETTVSSLKSYESPPIYGDKDEPSSYKQVFDVSLRVQQQNISSNDLVLLNFSPHTDWTQLRALLWREYCDYKRKKSSVGFRCIRKPSGVQIGDLMRIYDRNRHYPFWLSPRGNGIDCHRTWEALYLDIIPIVWNSSLNTLYDDLPVLIINDHQQLNVAFLREQLAEIAKKKLAKPPVYRYEKLRNAYWRRLILSKSRHAHVRNTFDRQGICWRAEKQTPWIHVKRLFFSD
jgi:hypothetical protein